MHLGIFKYILLLPLAAALLGCGATNPAVNKEFKELISLEKQQRKLEKKYFILLGHLEKFPDDRNLRLEQAEIKKKIQELNVKIKQVQGQLDHSVKEWEDRIIGDRLEKNKEDQIIRRNSPYRLRPR